MMLPNGYSDVPDGKVAAVVTCLDMHRRRETAAESGAEPWRLRRAAPVDPLWYRDLFRRIGSECLWYSRLIMPMAELDAILSNPAVEVYVLLAEGREEGLLELNFREPGLCELAFFGVTAELQGRGAARWLMNRAIERAWSRPIDRFWVHTCTLDHPAALRFYIRSGFRPFARRIEIADDPRLTGIVPRSAAAHLPIIEASP